MSSSSARNDETLHTYYSALTGRLSLQNGFHDIDNEDHFGTYLRQLQDAMTRNFVLDFGNDDAWCGMNLEQEDLALLLRHPRPRCFGTRWINIWAPEEQKNSIKAIMSYYGVSERLQGMMCTDPVAIPAKSSAPPQTLRRSFHRSVSGLSSSRMEDLEDGFLEGLSHLDEIQKAASFRDLTFAHITNQVWQFCSVDHGPRYTCIGYNSVYVIPDLDISNGRDLPNGRRLWSWLILCDDGTVISIQENPFPRIAGPCSDAEIKSVLSIVRRNVQMIFSGMSKQHFASSESDSLVTIRVRALGDSSSDRISIHQDDSPGLLFYYIFDDWVSSYALVAKREHQYGVLLDQLRQDMLTKPAVNLVNELHWLGRRLAVLKRLYQSYELILTRVLQRHRFLHDEARTHPKAATSQVLRGTEAGNLQHSGLEKNPSDLFISLDNSVGVRLNSAAVARIERLLDRIKLYCLSEIDACLTEKESLTFLNFNLIALKDSQAVERLTRITILLAKITILFLPVSLMTAYFSTELSGVKGVYTQGEYWISFAVVMVLSMLVLVSFGYASGTIEGKPIYRSLSRSFLSLSKDRLAHPRDHVD